ncbi:MAG: hypothetical protein VX265_10590 [Myxococcota bacterium]|nr:hypothetical protein [Myxococcota bacterium]
MGPLRRSRTRFAMLLAGTVGCGDPSPALRDRADLVSPCEVEVRAAVLRPGLLFEGEGIVARVLALSPDPPAAAATNAWTLELEPAPLEAPNVAMVMPDHGHGAPDGEAVLVEDGVDLWLDFTMPGFWEVTLASSDGVVVLPVCAAP